MTERLTAHGPAAALITGHRRFVATPQALAELERRAMSAAPPSVRAADEVLISFRTRLNEIDDRLDATATLAEARRRSDRRLSRRAVVIRGIAGFVLLMGPVLSLGTLVTRGFRSMPLDIALNLSAAFMTIAAAAALVMAIVAVPAVRFVRFSGGYLISTGIISVMVAFYAAVEPAWRPDLAGPDGARLSGAVVIASLVVAASGIFILIRVKAFERRIAAAIAPCEGAVKQIGNELESARADALAELGRLQTGAEAIAARSDRDAAVALMAKRYRIQASDAKALRELPLGAFQLAPDFVAVTDGTDA